MSASDVAGRRTLDRRRENCDLYKREALDLTHSTRVPHTAIRWQLADEVKLIERVAHQGVSADRAMTELAETSQNFAAMIQSLQAISVDMA